jgi:hypothetical protein
VLKEAEAGKPVKDICREHGITDQTYYRWKAKYGGLEVSGVPRRLPKLVGHPSILLGRCSEGLGSDKHGRNERRELSIELLFAPAFKDGARVSWRSKSIEGPQRGI